MLADKRETLELYISILGLDKRDTRESLQPWTLGASRGIGAHGNSWEEDRGRNWMEREREKEEEEMALLSFSSSIDRFGPLCPKRGRRI